MSNHHKLIILGSGPAGYTAAAGELFPYAASSVFESAR